MELNDTGHRERGNRRRWVVRHLSMALEVEEIDEKDFHISFARQLIENTGTARATERGEGTEIPFDDASEQQRASPEKK